MRSVSRIRDPSALCPTPWWCHSMMWVFRRFFVSQCLFYVEAKVLSVTLSVWFHDEAIAEGGCLETPPQC